MADAITLTLDRAAAADLLFRLLESRHHDEDAHECFLIVLLADALGENVGDWLRQRAAVFA